MKRFMNVLVFVSLFIAMTGTAMAITAKPGRRVFSQPDGSTFIAELKGDEHYSFAETPEGFSLVRNSQGYWTYAQAQNGLLAPSILIPGRDECPFPLHLRPNADAVAKLPENAYKMINVSADIRDLWAKQTLYGVGGTKEHPSKAASGKQYVNVILGDFSDSTFAWYANRQRLDSNPYGPFPFGVNAADDSAAQLRRFNFLVDGDSTSPFTNDSSVVGSMSNFYFDFTYRKCYWDGEVTFCKSGRTRSSSVSGQSPTATYYNAVLSAANTAGCNFDRNGDGTADNLMIVHPGPGQDESSDALDIWSMSMTGSFGSYDGVTITKMIFVAQSAQLGVFCHEMFHQVGGPDLYDYGYSSTPMGEWSLMDNGSWNGIVNAGDAPSFPGAFLAYDINGGLTGGIDGWLTQTDSISSARNGDGKYTIAALDSAGEARRGNTTSGIRLWRIRNTNFRDSAQVFFVELRRRTPPYEFGLSEDGLIITHIDTRMDCNDGSPATRAFYAWVEQPGYDPNPLYSVGDTNLPRSPSNAAYSADDYNPGGYTENRIDSTSIPNSWINTCYATTAKRTGPWIYDISREGPYMTFNVARSNMAAAVPVVGYQSCATIDPVISGTANNNNGMLDPWETDSLKVTVLNTGAAITAGAQCSLYVVKNAQYITVTPGWKNFGAGAIATNASAASDPFVVAVSSGCPRFLDVTFALKLKSTTPAMTDTTYFNVRISPLKVVKTYDFANIQVGGANYTYRIQPSDVAVWRDTLFVTNGANAISQTRTYKVKRSTANNPLVGGAGGDTLGSLNNKGSTHVATMYCCGADIDRSGNLWVSIQDSVFKTNRTNSAPTAKFKAPNVAWGGTPMKRIRGVSFGPATVDTIGPDPMGGDTLWAYWQSYYDAAAAGSGAESIYVMTKPLSGTAVRTAALGMNDSAWGAQAYAPNGYSWWNGRAIAYDGSNLWTTSVWQNVMIRRNPVTSAIIEMLPGPSMTGSYGTYGLAQETTDSLGNQYEPAGATAFVPYQKGTRHYLYCASMDEGKVYKVDVTESAIPTPPDSVKVQADVPSSGQNTISWWKANANIQKIYGYIIYRQAAGATAPPVPADSFTFVPSGRTGTAVSTTGTYVDVSGTKAAHKYVVLPVNYNGRGEWGASANASPLAIELTDFSCALVSGNEVTLRWATASESDLCKWLVERSTDGENYTIIAEIATSANPMGQRYTFKDQLSEPGMYYYKIYDVTVQNYATEHGPLVVTFGAPTAYALGRNFPNPVGTGATTIKYALKAPGRTSLKIYNVMGQEVRALVDQHQGANYYTVRWDGRDDAGQDVSNGIYFYKLISGNFTSTKKMMVLK